MTNEEYEENRKFTDKFCNKIWSGMGWSYYITPHSADVKDILKFINDETYNSFKEGYEEGKSISWATKLLTDDNQGSENTIRNARRIVLKRARLYPRHSDTREELLVINYALKLLIK